ncbi:hypothetical protein [Labrys neptuniae]
MKFLPPAGEIGRYGALFGPAFFGLLLSSVAHAADACGIDDLAKADLGLAKIKPAAGTDLRKGEAPCPDDSQGCKRQTHLARNTQVFTTGRVSGAYVCVYLAGNTMKAGGYVKQSEIEPRPRHQPSPLTAWSGTWRNFDNWIKLRVSADTLKAEGEAFWPSAHPSPGQGSGSYHTGSMEGVAKPRNDIVVFGSAPDDCQVIVALDRSGLVVSDNDACGGANVNFNGIYHRSKHKRVPHAM